MRVAIIAPIDMLELAALTDYHLILPHLMENDSYARFYSEVGGFKILDNGAAEPEGLSGDPSYLHDIGLHTNCDELVIPDALGDCSATIELARAFERHARRGRFGYVGVAQGRTIAEVVKCINYFSHCEWITTLALPRLLNNEPFLHHQRFSLVEPIFGEYGSQFPGGIHCLGASKWMREIVALDEAGCVRGMDTSLPIVMGLDHRNLADDYVARKPNYFNAKVDRNSLQWEVIKNNVKRYLDWGNCQPQTPISEL